MIFKKDVLTWIIHFLMGKHLLILALVLWSHILEMQNIKVYEDRKLTILFEHQRVPRTAHWH